MASILTGVVLILVVGGWITFDYLRSKSKLDREHAGVVQSCKVEPAAYISPLLSTIAMEAEVKSKVREVEQLRQKTGRLNRNRDTTRVMKPPSSEPQSDTAILKVVVDTAGEAERAAREKYAKKK